MPSPLISRLLLVTNGQDSYCLIFDAVQSDVSAVSKVDQPFPIFRIHILHGAAEIRLMGQNLNPRTYCPHGPPRGVNILEGQKTIEPLNVGQRWCSPDQT